MGTAYPTKQAWGYMRGVARPATPRQPIPKSQGRRYLRNADLRGKALVLQDEGQERAERPDGQEVEEVPQLGAGWPACHSETVSYPGVGLDTPETMVSWAVPRFPEAVDTSKYALSFKSRGSQRKPGRRSSIEKYRKKCERKLDNLRMNFGFRRYIHCWGPGTGAYFKGGVPNPQQELLFKAP